MNKVILIGRLTSDPEIVTARNSDLKIAYYFLAVDRPRRRNQGENEQNADFPKCTAFGKSAEFAEKYLRKGMKIAVEGKLTTGRYQKEDGSFVYTTEVTVQTQEFVESKKSREAAPDNYASAGGYPNGGSGSYGGHGGGNNYGGYDPYNQVPPQQGEFVELDDDEEVPF